MFIKEKKIYLSQYEICFLKIVHVGLFAMKLIIKKADNHIFLIK